MIVRYGMCRFPIMLLALCAVAHANTLEVGPGKPFATPCAAIGSAQAGDRIEVDAAGSYDGDTCEWTTDNLTVVGIGGRAKVDLTGILPVQEKGIFTIDAPNATIQSFELSGAAIPQGDGNNGAGIRHGGTNLTVIDCYFHDNQDGILGAPATAGTGTVVIQTSEFANNGAGDGQSHNMYLNEYASVTVEGSYSHGARVGHLLKSRGLANYILYNRLTDEAGTTASYEIDLPQGGTSYVIGNFIEQSAESQNPTIVASGEETPLNPDQHFFFINNTVVNDMARGTFLALNAGTTALLENNIFHGAGTVTSLAGATQTTNWTDAQGDPMLASVSTFDYHLQAGSPCIDRGTLPGMPALVPTEEYVQPLMLEGRAVAGAAIDIGADEVGGETPLGGDAGISDVDGGTTSPAMKGSGCGCQAPGDPGGLAIVLACAFGLRRRRPTRTDP
jgi:MYXO-CTERM domain-containing protein